MNKIIILLILSSCMFFKKELTPEEVALKYQETRYTDYENSFQYLWPNSVKKEDFLKFKVSYINFQEIKNKFKFKITKVESNNDEKIVSIEITRPDIETISKNIYLAKIGQSPEAIQNMIKEEMKKENCPLKTIISKTYVKKYSDKIWYVLPRVN